MERFDQSLDPKKDRAGRKQNQQSPGEELLWTTKQSPLSPAQLELLEVGRTQRGGILEEIKELGL